MILFLALLTQRPFAQTPIESSSDQKNDYGIELKKQYPGTMVLELMQEAESEIDQAVDDAYSAGYKSATLLFSPDLEKYKQLYHEEKAKHTIAEKVFIGVCCFFAGFAGGSVTVALLK